MIGIGRDSKEFEILTNLGKFLEEAWNALGYDYTATIKMDKDTMERLDEYNKEVAEKFLKKKKKK